MTQEQAISPLQAKTTIKKLIGHLSKVVPDYWPSDDLYNDDFVVDLKRGLLSEPKGIPEGKTVMGMIISGEEIDPTGGEEIAPKAYAEHFAEAVGILTSRVGSVSELYKRHRPTDPDEDPHEVKLKLEVDGELEDVSVASAEDHKYVHLHAKRLVATLYQPSRGGDLKLVTDGPVTSMTVEEHEAEHDQMVVDALASQMSAEELGPLREKEGDNSEDCYWTESEDGKAVLLCITRVESMLASNPEAREIVEDAMNRDSEKKEEDGDQHGEG